MTRPTVDVSVVEALRQVGVFAPVEYGPGGSAASPDVPTAWVGRLPTSATGSDAPVVIRACGGCDP